MEEKINSGKRIFACPLADKKHNPFLLIDAQINATADAMQTLYLVYCLPTIQLGSVGIKYVWSDSLAEAQYKEGEKCLEYLKGVKAKAMNRNTLTSTE